MISDEDVRRIAEAGAELPAAEGVYIEDDFVTNLMATVIDYQTQSIVVERAIVHYKENRWDEIRTFEDLKRTFDNFDDSRDGDTALAQHQERQRGGEENIQRPDFTAAGGLGLWPVF